MQYAQIIPNTKTSQAVGLFTYKIPPEILTDIQIGSLVQIPFGNRKLIGLVWDIKKKKPSAALNKKLKAITKILAPQPQIIEIQKKLIDWLAKYYYSSLSEVAFSVLPSPLLKKGTKKNPIIKNPKITNIDLLFRIRFYNYQKLIKNNPKKQTILLFPTTEMAEMFYFYFQKIYKDKVGLYHAGLSKSEKWRTYQKILNQKVKIVIGSQIAIFSPLLNLGQIIIDDANSDNYKQDQSPRYDARIVAQKLSKLHQAHLFFFTPTIPLDSYKPIKNKQIIWLKPESKNQPKTQIIDLTNEYQNNNYGLLSGLVKQKIIENYQAQKKIILFINKKGAASLVLCQDCNYIFKCPNCQSILTFRAKYYQGSRALVCHNCQYESQEFHQCPKCKGINLKFLGGGTEKLESEVKKLIPKVKILRIEKDDLKKLPARVKNYEIIIATQKIIHENFSPADLVVAVQPDLSLNLPDFRAAEKTFNLLKWLKLYSKNNFLIQTNNPRHFVFQAISKKNDLIFYKNELSIRKKEQYPPFSKIIKLFIAHSKRKIAEEEAKKLFQKLSKSSNKQFKILGPSPSYYLKKHNKYIWQIILKGQNPYQALKYVSKNWKIDIDPVSLL